MRTCFTFALAASAFAFSLFTFGQGALLPPGAPEAVKKTLHQLEPRTCISELPYVIDEPGSYYVAEPLSTTSSGIVVRCSHVTIDLNGFSLTGDAGKKYGIHIEGTEADPIVGVAIENGLISDFYIGIYAEYVEGLSCRKMACSANSSSGMLLMDAEACSIRQCIFADNLHGAALQSAGGCALLDCSFSGNADNGVSLQSSTGNRIHGCKFTGPGISVTSSQGNLLDGNRIYRAVEGSFGIDTSSSGGRNVIVGNKCWDADILTDTDDTAGPVISAAGRLDGSTSNAAHPWANFSLQ
jgi:parallel beta-helix repeat protein